MRFPSSLKCLTNAHSYKWGPVPLQLLSIFHSFCFFSFFFVFFEASVNFAPISAAAAVDVDMYVAMWMRGCPHHRSHTDANTHTSANTCCW